MIELTIEQFVELKNWFSKDCPGYLVGQHVLQTGHGSGWVDQWPSPRVLIAKTGGNCALFGSAAALTSAMVQAHIHGFVEADEAFVPLLKIAFPDLRTWQRVVYAPGHAPKWVEAKDCVVRRLSSLDTEHLEEWANFIPWLCESWGSPAALAGSGFAWGSFVDGQLVSMAYTFLLGENCEEVGVVTHPDFRSRGFSTACASALCSDIQAREHQAIWTTGAEMAASIRVAEKLGFTFQRDDVLYVTEAEMQ